MTKEALRKLIDRTGLMQKDFAAKLKVSPRTLIRWLKGTTPVSRATAALIRETFPE